jgi:hypothetical protein
MSGGILLATVGGRDPAFDGEPTGPLRAALALRPAVVVLVRTDGTAQNARTTQARIESDLPGTGLRLHRLDGDPSDRRGLLERCHELVENLRGGGGIRAG